MLEHLLLSRLSFRQYPRGGFGLRGGRRSHIEVVRPRFCLFDPSVLQQKTTTLRTQSAVLIHPSQHEFSTPPAPDELAVSDPTRIFLREGKQLVSFFLSFPLSSCFLSTPQHNNGFNTTTTSSPSLFFFFLPTSPTELSGEFFLGIAWLVESKSHLNAAGSEQILVEQILGKLRWLLVHESAQMTSEAGAVMATKTASNLAKESWILYTVGLFVFGARM